jgi:TonB family protein
MLLAYDCFAVNTHLPTMSKSAGSPKKKKQFVKQPQYEGGAKALQAFIMEHISYPEEALTANIEGDVLVKYDVSEEGVVIGAKVLRGIGFGCDEEALRIVKLLRFTPARNRGLHVTSHFDITIHFRLPYSIESSKRDGTHYQTAPTVLSYTYFNQTPDSISNTAQLSPAQKPQFATYNYTLTVNIPASSSTQVSTNMNIDSSPDTPLKSPSKRTKKKDKID